ncbi:MAG: response regulator [Bacillota bacterium]
MATILVVEDDAHVSDMIQLALEREGYKVLKAFDGATGLDMARAQRPDLVVLDLMLPVMDGFSVCRAIRQNQQTPILILTARSDEVDKVLGLELGADDYLTKPFSPRELVARIRAILRRATPGAGEERQRLDFPSLTIDLDGHEVTVAGEPVSLTPKEFDLLAFLAATPGHVFSRDQLLSSVWGYSYTGDGRTVDEHIKRLRQKVEARSAPYRYLRTVRGAGYKFEVMT